MPPTGSPSSVWCEVRGLLALYMRLSGVTLEPGPHLLNDALSPRELVQRLARRATRPSSRVTIPEGWHHLQIAERLDHEWICSSSSFRSAVTDRALLAELGVRAESAEGYLFPASYELGLDSDPKNVVRLLVRETKKRLARLDASMGALASGSARASPDRTRAFDSGLDRRKGSRPPRRTSDDRERVLQSAAATRSFCPSARCNPIPRPATAARFFPNGRRAARATPDRSPRRCCVTPRTPTTPTATPDCLRARSATPGKPRSLPCFRPAKTDFLFFVSRGDGRHTFSRSFADHNAAIERSRR